jgi:tRNA (guanine-N7-)-methyltransferase
MRLRNVVGAKDKINSGDRSFDNPLELKGKWNQVFKNSNPIHIEIGTGKGGFIIGMAKRNPKINYIGIEKYDSVLVRALEKLEESEVSNVRLVRFDAIKLTELFAENEVSRVYLNFSDPWPKVRHAKRRLTHKNFLTQYQNILVDDGELHFKTDNRALFEFSLESLCNYGVNLKNVSLDLHQTEFHLRENVTTEYERKFSEKGFKIKRLEANFKQN